MTNWNRTIAEVCRGITIPAVDGQAYGVEVELEAVYNGTAFVDQAQWTIVGDGSLRDGGMEFITPPVNADTVRESVQALYEARDRAGWTYGQRCGIHVHMDMSGKTMRQLHAFVVAYACVEPVLFHYCGAEREQNIFCIPWYRAQTGLPQATEFIYHPIRDQLSRLRRAQPKYTALYLEPLARFGTVEFRGAPVFPSYQGFNVFFTALEELVTSTANADAEEILEIFLDDPEAGLGIVMPSSRGHGALIDEVDSPAVAASLVRTKPLPPTWEFLGLNVDDLEPRVRQGRNREGIEELLHNVRVDLNEQLIRQPIRRRR